MACFSMKPDKTVFDQLWESAEWDSQRMYYFLNTRHSWCEDFKVCMIFLILGIRNEFLGIWFQNQGTALKTGKLPNGILADFNVSRGKLLGYAVLF